MEGRPIENILNELGAVIGKLGSSDSDSYFFFFQLQEGVYSEDLFQDVEDDLVYIDPKPLDPLTWEIWRNFEGQWSTLRYRLRGDKFSAIFDYDQREIDFTGGRLKDALKAEFGDKRLVYPSPD